MTWRKSFQQMYYNFLCPRQISLYFNLLMANCADSHYWKGLLCIHICLDIYGTSFLVYECPSLMDANIQTPSIVSFPLHMHQRTIWYITLKISHWRYNCHVMYHWDWFNPTTHSFDAIFCWMYQTWFPCNWYWLEGFSGCLKNIFVSIRQMY